MKPFWCLLFLGCSVFGQDEAFDLFDGKIDLELDPAVEAAERLGIGGDLEDQLELIAAELLQTVLELDAPPAGGELQMNRLFVEPPMFAVDPFTDIGPFPPKDAAEEDEEEEKPPLSEEEIADVLKGSEVAVEQITEQNMDLAYEQILAHTRLDEDRRQQLQEAKKAVVRSLVEDWRQKMLEEIPDWSEQRRDQMRMGQLYVQPGTDEAEHEDWKRAVDRILSEAQRTAMEESIAGCRQRRTEALMRILIAELHPHIGFDPDQRTALLRAGIPLLDDLDDSFFVPRARGYTTLDLYQIFSEIQKDAGMVSILDEGQQKRWADLEASDISRNRGHVSHTLGNEDTPAVSSDVEAEKLLGKLLFDAAKRERESHLAMMQARLDLICRVASPSDDTRARLMTLAKGSAEILAEPRISNMARSVRQQVKDTHFTNLPERLRQIHVSYYSRSNSQNKWPGLWTNTIKAILSPAQLAVVQAHDATAEAWDDHARAMIALTEVEKYVPLPLMPREALLNRLQRSIETYRSQLDQIFSSSWHLQGYYCCIPLEMIQADEGLDAFFNEQELQLIRERCLANTGQFVDQLQRNSGRQNPEDPQGIPRCLAR